jgi:hypothetical protein
MDILDNMNGGFLLALSFEEHERMIESGWVEDDRPLNPKGSVVSLRAGLLRMILEESGFSVGTVKRFCI